MLDMEAAQSEAKGLGSAFHNFKTTFFYHFLESIEWEQKLTGRLQYIPVHTFLLELRPPIYKKKIVVVII